MLLSEAFKQQIFEMTFCCSRSRLSVGDATRSWDVFFKAWLRLRPLLTPCTLFHGVDEVRVVPFQEALVCRFKPLHFHLKWVGPFPLLQNAEWQPPPPSFGVGPHAPPLRTETWSEMSCMCFCSSLWRVSTVCPALLMSAWYLLLSCAILDALTVSSCLCFFSSRWRWSRWLSSSHVLQTHRQVRK